MTTNQIERVGEALRRECLAIFGSTWSNDIAWRLASTAIKEMDPDVLSSMAAERRNALLAGLILGFLAGAAVVLLMRS